MGTSHPGGFFTIQYGRQDPKYKEKSTNAQNFNYKYSRLINMVTKYVYTGLEYKCYVIIQFDDTLGDIIQDGHQVLWHDHFTLFGLWTGFYFYFQYTKLSQLNLARLKTSHRTLEAFQNPRWPPISKIET